MLLNDSIIRCRYREGFEREVLMEPGDAVRRSTIQLPPTRNLFAAGHRIRVDVSSSNFPRLERNPNTGEPIGRHTHMVVGRADRVLGGDAIVLPVIPGVIELGGAGPGAGRSGWAATRRARSRRTTTSARGASSRVDAFRHRARRR